MFIVAERPGPEPKDRKVQKADREKLRRDRLNEQFAELGKTLGMLTYSLHTIVCEREKFFYAVKWRFVIFIMK